MGKKLPDAVLDAPIEYIADTYDRLHVCSDEPASYAGIAAVELAAVDLTVGVGNGDYTKGDGDVSGRKLTIAAQEGLTAGGTGNATHIVLSDGSSLLGPVTTCTSQGVTSGNTVNVPAWDIEFADPS